MTKKIVLASGNAGKLAEMRALLSDLPIHLVSQETFHLVSPEETGTTFVENAIIKARYAAKQTGLPAVADDSGLVINALGGGPGVYTARFGGEKATPMQKIAALLEAMRQKTDRRVVFYSVIVFMRDEKDPAPIICQGVWRGEVLHEPRGTQGFGYDPIFYVPTHDCSAAELPPALKNQLSHRGQALSQLKQVLRDQIF